MTSPFNLDHASFAETIRKNVARYLSAEDAILFDGVFKGDYSLAVVNRYLARALIESGLNVKLYTSEQDWEEDYILGQMPDILSKMISEAPVKGQYDIHLRNNWPPTANDMVGSFNAYVCFAWEEMEFAEKWVREFNNNLDTVMVTSNFVRDSLLHSGISIPVHVVGNGCDHFTKNTNQLRKANLISNKTKTFLHVSSCFPRKGVDILIEAFSKTFNSDENVELVIKTFANPHNDVANLIALAKNAYPNSASIRLIEHSLPDDELKDLYLNSIALVAPSRGEGFGLPMAEAMLMNIPVVTTGYSGQLDFCKPETAWLIDFHMVKSKAHVAGPFSMWAEPDVDSLCRNMRSIIDKPSEVLVRSMRAKKNLDAHFTWSLVAQRIIKVLTIEKFEVYKKQAENAAPVRIDIVSSWQQQCGIATYCESLMGTTDFADRLGHVFARVYALDNITGSKTQSSPIAQDVHRLWGYDFAGTTRLGHAIVNSNNPVIWFQHHPGFFSLEDMQYLSIKLRVSKYLVKVITLHNVKEIVFNEISWLNAFDLVFVHTAIDAEMLSKGGIGNVVVVPHGIPDIPNVNNLNSKNSFIVGAFGFLYPHKNIPMLINAVSIARRFSTRIQLRLLNCAKSDDTSRWEQARVETMIEILGATSYVDVEYGFLEEKNIISQLSQCTLIAFPYGDSPESATGAARIALAANCPLLISRSGVLDDLTGYAHRLNSLTAEHLAEAILVLASCPDLLHAYDLERDQFTKSFSYNAVAKRYAANIQIALERIHIQDLIC